MSELPTLTEEAHELVVIYRKYLDQMNELIPTEGPLGNGVQTARKRANAVAAELASLYDVDADEISELWSLEEAAIELLTEALEGGTAREWREALETVRDTHIAILSLSDLGSFYDVHDLMPVTMPIGRQVTLRKLMQEDIVRIHHGQSFTTTSGRRYYRVVLSDLGELILAALTN